MCEPPRHIATFYVAGFQHWNGATVIDQLKAGSPLQLAAEPNNPHDSEAVAPPFADVFRPSVEKSPDKKFAPHRPRTVRG